MSIANCIECGALCMKSPTKRCAPCQQRANEDEDKISEYLFDHPHATLEEIHDATKVQRHIIMEMIRKGRILVGSVTYACESCKTMIASGRLCSKCSTIVLAGLAPSTPEKAVSHGHTGLFVMDHIAK